jgi:hypothetical protein
MIWTAGSTNPPQANELFIRIYSRTFSFSPSVITEWEKRIRKLNMGGGEHRPYSVFGKTNIGE